MRRHAVQAPVAAGLTRFGSPLSSIPAFVPSALRRRRWCGTIGVLHGSYASAKVPHRRTSTSPGDTSSHVSTSGDLRKPVGAPRPDGSSALKPWCMEAALFDVSDMHTGLITHLSPRQRVVTQMSLLPRHLKRYLLTDARWFQQVLECEDGADAQSTTHEPTNQTPATAPPPLPTDTTPPQTSLATGDEEAAAANPAEEVVSTEPATPTPSTESPLLAGATTPAMSLVCLERHMEVIGRAKVVRYLLVQFLRRSELWWDSAQALLACATARVTLPDENDERHDGLAVSSSVTPPALLPFTSPLVTRPNTVPLWSESTVQSLMEFVRIPHEDFRGPRALWLTHVVRHRHDSELLASPQRPPFSFGELRPTVAPSDMQLRPAVTHGATDPSSGEARRPSTSMDDSTALTHEMTDATDGDMEWSALSEYEQNVSLFGQPAAQLARRTVGAPTVPGVYVIDNYVREAPAPLVVDVDVTGFKEAMASAAALEAKQRREEAIELRALQRYKIDSESLQQLEPTLIQLQHGDDGPGAEQSSGPLPVQMASLWKSFQSASTSTTLDAYVSFQSALGDIQRNVAREVAAQTAVQLLFFARDEVRLVTAPEKTSAHLWRLHRRLLSVLHSLATLEGTAAPYDVVPPAGVPHFTSLSAVDQLSFACFGCTHLFPLLRDSEEAVSPAQPLTPLPEGHRYADATELYDALTTLYPERRAGERAADDATYSGVPAHTVLMPTARVPLLTDVQSMALEFCFPRNASEVHECLGISVAVITPAEVPAGEHTPQARPKRARGHPWKAVEQKAKQKVKRRGRPPRCCPKRPPSVHSKSRTRKNRRRCAVYF